MSGRACIESFLALGRNPAGAISLLALFSAQPLVQTLVEARKGAEQRIN
jgi:hypothetical protein